MFYSYQILSKKGPLGRIWIAAHLDKRLTKQQIAQTDIPTSVQYILNSEAPLALRLEGHLLLGLAKIYLRKVKYLMEDTNDALAKIKLAFRPAAIDLPAESKTAAYNAITLPEFIELEVEHDIPLANSAEDAHGVQITLDQPFLNEPRTDELFTGFGASDDAEAFGFGFGEDIELLRGEDIALRADEPAVPPPDLSGFGGDHDFDVPLPHFDDNEMPASAAATPLPPVFTPKDISIGAATPSFALPTPDVTVKQPSRKRAATVILDEATELSSDLMKQRIEGDWSHITRKEAVMLPGSRKALMLMQLEAQGVEALFSQPIQDNLHHALAARITELLLRKRPGEPVESTPKKVKTPKEARAESPAALAVPAEVEAPPMPEFPEDEGAGVGGAYMPPTPDAYDVPMPEFDETPIAERGTGAAAEAGASLFDTEPSSASQQPTPGHMSHRTKKMVQVLESKFQEEGPKIDFSKLITGLGRRPAAQAFFELLVLKSRNQIDVKQPKPFGPITISRPIHA